MKTTLLGTILAATISWVASTPSAVAQRDIPPAERKVIDEYVAIQKSLADDSMEHVAHHASAIAKTVSNHQVDQLPHAAATQAEAVAKAKDIKGAREAFKELSKSFEQMVRGFSKDQTHYRIAYCPMAKAGWVQTGKVIANPYYGKSMLKCGTFKR